MSIDKENTQGESNMGVFFRTWQIFRPYHKMVYLILLMQVVVLALEFLGPYIYGLVIDSIVSGAPLNKTVQLVLLSFVVGIVLTIFSLLKQNYEIRNFDLDSIRHVDEMAADKLFKLSVGQHRNEHTGMVQGVINDGRNAIKDIFNTGTQQALPIALSLPFASVAVFLLSPTIGLVVLVGMSIYIWATLHLNRKFRPEIKKNQENYRQVGKRSMELLRNAPTVIISAEEDKTVVDIRDRMLARDDHAKHLWTRFLFWSNVRSTAIDVASSVALILAALLVSKGDLRVGAVVTIMIWVSRVFGDVSQIGRMSRILLEARERALKFFKMFDVESDVPLPENPKVIERPKGLIEFRDVTFKYGAEKINAEEDEEKTKEKSHQALDGISFRIEPGEHIAFVGKSGSGKSTTVLLLLRGQDPNSGEILVDEVDLRELHLEKYRRAVGVVEQNIILFDDTMRYNISYGLGEGRLLSDEELDEIAKTTRIDQFKDRLTNGWDTIIGENGVKLSGGERQRVGIARALAKNPSILVFDEATSSLDPENERLIKEAIDKVSEGRTVISIAHRLSTILNANRIFVFEKGKIVDVGTHEELLKRSPAYQVQVSGQTVVV